MFPLVCHNDDSSLILCNLSPSTDTDYHRNRHMNHKTTSVKPVGQTSTRTRRPANSILGQGPYLVSRIVGS